MTKTMQGIIHGKTIELLSDPGLSDGESVRLVIETAAPRPTRSAADRIEPMWGEETDRIFDELQRERHPVRPFVPPRTIPRLTLTEIMERAVTTRSTAFGRTRDQIDAELAALRDEADQELAGIETLHHEVVAHGSQR